MHLSEYLFNSIQVASKLLVSEKYKYDNQRSRRCSWFFRKQLLCRKFSEMVQEKPIRIQETGELEEIVFHDKLSIVDMSDIQKMLCYSVKWYCVSKQNRLQFESEHIAIIHSYGASVINTDNEMITSAHIGRIIWINQVIERKANTATNNF